MLSFNHLGIRKESIICGLKLAQEQYQIKQCISTAQLLKLICFWHCVSIWKNKDEYKWCLPGFYWGRWGWYFGKGWKTNIARWYYKAYNRNKYHMLCGTKSMKQEIIKAQEHPLKSTITSEILIGSKKAKAY